jgi:hypothetical protein
LTDFAHALPDAQAQVAGLNRAREAGIQVHREALQRIEHAHELSMAQPGITDEDVEVVTSSRDTARGRVNAVSDAGLARLAGQYENLVAELGAHARRVGQELATATVFKVPDRSVSTWLGHTGPPCMRGELTVEQAAMNALEGSLPLLHRREAEDAVKDVQGLLLAAAGGDIEALRRLREQDRRWATDPYFAHGLAASLGPEGLTTVANRMQAAMRGDGGSRLSAADAKWLATYFGSVIAVASNPVYDNALDEASRDEHRVWREQEWFPGWIKAGNAGGTDSYLALTQFLEGGAAAHVQPGAAFMGKVGADILLWDKTTWTTQDIDQWRVLWPAPVSFLDGAFPSPVSGLLLAAHGDRAAEQALLLADVGGESALRYLVKDRHFELPLLSTKAEAAAWDPDYNDLLGDMVLEADMDRTDQVGTHVASEFAGAYVDGIYESRPLAAGEFAGQSPFGVDHASLRPTLALVLGYHVRDLAAALCGANPVELGKWRDGTWGIEVSDARHLAATFADLAFDRPEDLGKDPATLAKNDKKPPAISLLLHLVLGQTGNSLTDFASQQPLPTGAITSAASDGAIVLRYILESSQAGLMGNAEAKDSANKELAQLWSQGVGLIPLSKLGPAAGVTGSILQAQTDNLLAGLLPTDLAARKAVANMDTKSALDTLMVQQIQTTLASAGAWEAGKTPSQWLAASSSSFTPADDARFIDVHGKVLQEADMSYSQKHAYREFLGDDQVITDAIREAGQSALVSSIRAGSDYSRYLHLTS